MSPTDQLRREIQERSLRAIQLVEECNSIVKAELNPYQSTYRLARRKAIKLDQKIKEALSCLRKLLVNI